MAVKAKSPSAEKFMIVNRNRGNDEIEFCLTLLVTEDCNLRCSYCFEPEKRPRRMPFEIARDAVREYLSREEGPDALSIDFCGGEPMLEFDLIRRVFDYCMEQGPWRKRFRLSLGTNGTVLTEKMRRWFEAHPCFQISVSLDGIKEVHDRNRSNSYDAVIRNIDFFRRYDQTVKMTISPHTVPRLAECVVHIHELGLKPEANVVFEPVWGSPGQKAALLHVYARELDKLVEFYSLNPQLTAPKLVAYRIEALMWEDGYSLEDKYCGAGKYMTAVMPDGQRYPCHRFSPLATKKPVHSIKTDNKVRGPEKCVRCPIYRLCHSCLGANHDINGSVDMRTDFHCEFVKAEVLASAKLAERMLSALAAGLSHEEIAVEDDKGSKLALMRQMGKAIQFVQENVHLAD